MTSSGISPAIRTSPRRSIRATTSSGFDHYCRDGYAKLSPHWLFDERQYRARYHDLADAVFPGGDFFNGYDHYIRHGSREGRIGHLLFEPALYRSALPAEEQPHLDEGDAFAHCLARIEGGGAEVRVSPFFDPAFYRRRHSALCESGEWRWALEHYLRNDTPTCFDPLAEFSEAFYLARYPDVAAAVAAGHRRNGYDHYLTDGAREMRTPHPAMDLAWYVGAYPEICDDLRCGRATDAFDHYLRIGAARGWAAAPPAECAVEEPGGRTLFRMRARSLLPVWGRTALDFTLGGPPALSVIMVVHGQFALTMMALASLRANFAGPIELVLVDSGSADETRRITRYVRGARLLRFDSNIGFVRACNAALSGVTADAVLFLNNDVELAPGAVAVALRRIGSDSRIGAVGGKVLRSHGVLQEAGSIVWRDGETAGYLRDASPLAPEANFVRDVDFCSAVFLLVRASLLASLGGFDVAFSPAYCEDVDLCVRIAQAGFRVVFDPAIVVHHLEHGSSSTRASAEAQMAAGHTTFVARHNAWLATRPEGRDALRARSADRRPHVLLIEDMVPLRALGSGYVRSNDVVAVMAGMGLQVTVFPLRRHDADLAAVYADFPDTIEVMHDRSLDDLADFLRDRAGLYATIWVVRTHNLERVLAALPEQGAKRPRIVLDTEAIAAMREASRRALRGQPDLDLASAIRRELAGAELCDALAAVTSHDAAVLRDLGFGNVHVLGHLRPAVPTPAAWSERAGLLFVGAIHDADSPNYDALDWFVSEVLPLIERELGWCTRLTVAGYTADDVDLTRLGANSRITLQGCVADTLPLYAAHRVFVAPTRFAAGVPYKVHEAASYGLPVVATDLLRGQLGWDDGQEIVAAPATDAAAFAEAVLSLYRSEALWTRVRDGALARLQHESVRERYVDAIRTILGSSAA